MARAEYPELFDSSQEAIEAPEVSAENDVDIMRQSPTILSRQAEEERSMPDSTQGILENETYEMAGTTVASAQQQAGTKTVSNIQVNNNQVNNGLLNTATSSKAPSNTPTPTAQVPTNATYLPYATQHQLLRELQELLEVAFFDFASKHFPKQLASRGWQCAENVELSEWARLLPSWHTSVVAARPEFAVGKEQSLELVLSDLVLLRNAAVHRQLVTDDVIQKFFKAAIESMAAIKDDSRRDLMQKASDKVDTCLAEMHSLNDESRASAKKQVEILNQQRRELSIKENEVRRILAEKELEHSARAGVNIGEATKGFSVPPKTPQEESEADELRSPGTTLLERFRALALMLRGPR